MNEQAFERWLQQYGRAWETRDPDAAVDLFTEDARYYESPFDEPFRGRDAIRAYWAEVPRAQTDISFGYEVLAVRDRRGIARWWAEFTRIRQGRDVRLDGIFVVTMAEDGRCHVFREWWHRQEKESG